MNSGKENNNNERVKNLNNSAFPAPNPLYYQNIYPNQQFVYYGGYYYDPMYFYYQHQTQYCPLYENSPPIPDPVDSPAAVDEITDGMSDLTTKMEQSKFKREKSKRGKFVDIFSPEPLKSPKTVPDPSKVSSKPTPRPANQMNPLNVLDSSAPKNYPGKKSEKSRLTTLKKVIIRERNRPSEDKEEEIPPNEDLTFIKMAKEAIHSDKFREYCDHFTTIEIDEVVSEIVERLKFFQSRNMQKNSYKAKTKLRFTLGIREVIKHLTNKRIRLLLVAPNIENIKDKGGLNDCIDRMLTLCREQNVPYVFALSRHRLGKLISNRIPASIIGVFDYSGVEPSVARLESLREISRKFYIEALNEHAEAFKAGKKVPCKLRIDKSHIRNISDGSAVSFSSSIMSKPISQHVEEVEGAKNLLLGSKSDTLKVEDILGQNHLRNGSNCSAISDLPDSILQSEN